MSFESEYRQNTYYGNMEKSKRLQNAVKDLAPPITSESDRRFVEKRRSSFEAGESPEDAFRAKALEAVTVIRINQGAWFNDPADNTYFAEATPTNGDDDISNCSDVMVTLHTTEDSPAQTEADLPFSIDVTTTNDPDKITSKLLVGTNDPGVSLPVGFTRLKYYKHPDGQIGNMVMPRYCIGISSQSVDDILEMTDERPDKSFSFGGSDLTTRFKILYEMSLQNQLFEGPLYYQEDSGTLSDEHEKLLRQMEQLDAVYVTELTKLAKRLPDFATRGTDFDLQKIALNLQKGQFGDDGDETFRMICEQTERITDAMFDSEEPDKTLKQLADDARRAKRGG